jgi:hypothetical protein
MTLPPWRNLLNTKNLQIPLRKVVIPQSQSPPSISKSKMQLGEKKTRLRGEKSQKDWNRGSSKPLNSRNRLSQCRICALLLKKAANLFLRRTNLTRNRPNRKKFSMILLKSFKWILKSSIMGSLLSGKCLGAHWLLRILLHQNKSLK